MSDFLHSASEKAGFYRNSESAKKEAIVIKNNALNGPKRPRPKKIEEPTYAIWDQPWIDKFLKSIKEEELNHVVGVFYD